MIKTPSLLMAAALLLVAACVTPTPYQPKDRAGYGFSEERLEANRFRIDFRGNAVTDRAQVENAMLYRAAEVTLANGYDYFVATDRALDKHSSLVSEGPAYPNYYPGPFFRGRYYARGFGWRGWYDPFWDMPANYYQVTRYEASGEIVLYKGHKPAGDPHAFDAREVEANLRGKVMAQTPPPAR
jgi:hypothetical protein